MVPSLEDVQANCRQGTLEKPTEAQSDGTPEAESAATKLGRSLEPMGTEPSKPSVFCIHIFLYINIYTHMHTHT